MGRPIHRNRWEDRAAGTIGTHAILFRLPPAFLVASAPLLVSGRPCTRMHGEARVEWITTSTGTKAVVGALT